MNFIKFFVPVLLFFNIASAQLELENEECTADLFVETDLKEASIYLNGRPSGLGKLSVTISKGTYVITAKENLNSWNLKSFTDTLLADECRKYTLSYKFSTQIYLKTDPQDVYVYNGNTLYGHTPLFIDQSLVGKSIELRKPGYEDRIVLLENLKNSEIIKLNYKGKEEDRSFFEKDLFKILTGSLLVLGGTTAYFKLKADNEFEKYQFSSSSQSLKNTRRYDLISGISFAALQVNFGVLIYYLLFD
jgi:hypothetical protein